MDAVCVTIANSLKSSVNHDVTLRTCTPVSTYLLAIAYLEFVSVAVTTWCCLFIFFNLESLLCIKSSSEVSVLSKHVNSVLIQHTSVLKL